MKYMNISTSVFTASIKPENGEAMIRVIVKFNKKY